MAESTMEKNLTDIGKYGITFHILLKHFATSIPQGRWFIINYDDDEDANTLASFLCIRYTELQALLHQIGIMVTVAGKIGLRRRAMESFLVGIEQVEYTVSRLPYRGGSPHIYHLLRIGPYGASHGVFDFTTQKEMATAGLILVRPPRFTDHHKQLSEHVRELVNDAQNAESTIDSKLDGEEAEADTAMCTPKRLVEGQDGTDLDTKPQALFDMPTQVLVGAKHILEEIDMAEFPMLAQLNIKLSTDYYLRALQRELEKLSNVIESIDLKNFCFIE